MLVAAISNDVDPEPVSSSLSTLLYWSFVYLALDMTSVLSTLCILWRINVNYRTPLRVSIRFFAQLPAAGFKIHNPQVK